MTGDDPLRRAMRADTPRIFKAVYSNVIRQNHNWLVVFRHPSEKYEFVNGKDDIPCMKWKIKHVSKITIIQSMDING